MLHEITVIGNLVQDAEVKDVSSRKAINFAVAMNETYTGKDGEKMEKPHFYNCTMWRKENIKVATYMTKGTKVFVRGTPEVEVYKTKEGEVRGSIKITVTEFIFLGKGAGHNVAIQDVNAEGGAHKDLPF